MDPARRDGRDLNIGGHMGAGDRAAEQARRASERAARLRRELEQAERAERAWAAGAAGEARVAEILDSLRPDGWYALHDVHWPGRPKANLDHVLVGPGGIIVIDAKNWAGDVAVRNGVLRQNGYSRERSAAGALEQCAVIAAVLEPQHRRLVQGWLCMVGQPTMPRTTTSGVEVLGLDSLGSALRSLPTVLDPATVSLISQYLANLLTGASSPALMTTQRFPASRRDFLPTSGPAAALAQRRRQMTRDPADDPQTRSRPGSRRRRSRKRDIGCFGALFRLALFIFVLGVFLTFLPQHESRTPGVPTQAPTLTQPAP
ncbi:nuclease-related domain-containing protein [Pseudarthrobacter sp. NPDC058362]|uniref:nuclease-related domain-containing protein n=1 Tax=Pseudarthrobacter sp. NPDC058362 TaxID=3346458 RepID=UPI003651973C